MEAIETLMSEHRTIERAIEALLAFGDEVRRGAGDAAELGRFVRFIREFADALHHAKEESVLFAAMVEAGFPRHAGPIGVMLHDHEEGRRHVGVLAGLAERPAPWTAGERETLLEAAHGYADLLRAHIQKEDTILYPMAEQRLPDVLALRVDEDCAAFEACAAADGRRATLERLGAELVARHLPGLA
jgi:hemerythrin-like domain-containing protein